MLIDWVTCRVPLDSLGQTARETVVGLGDRVTRYCPTTGEERWTMGAWDSVRSDSHQLAVRVGSELWVQGSPARVLGDGCTVFGSGVARALELVGCVQAMTEFVATRLGVELPRAAGWKVSRVDVTANLSLRNLGEVRRALATLRECEGGRYRVSHQAGDTVYWSHRSKLRAAKAYAKGPHLEYLLRQKTYTGRTYNGDELRAADRLLRLELKLGREWFRRVEWQTVSGGELRAQWQDYFGRMIGAADMADERDLLGRVQEIAPGRRGRAVYATWLLCKEQGWERTRDTMARSTFYRHMAILRASGMGDADLSNGNVVPLRFRVLEAAEVSSWEELRAA